MNQFEQSFNGHHCKDGKINCIDIISISDRTVLTIDGIVMNYEYKLDAD